MKMTRMMKKRNREAIMEKTLDVKLIHPNRYQPASRRTFTAAQVADLDSIGEIGLQQKPHVRAHPQKAGEYELIFGHRRVAWWRLHQAGTLMPVDVVEADDRVLFDVMISENEDRLSTNAIEKAQLLRAYMAEFKLSQADAGKHFHLATQGGVSNLLRLLELPEEIQALVANGQLPERLARRLLALKSLDAEKAIIELAEEVAAHSSLESDSLTSKKNIFAKDEMTQEQLFEARIGSLVSQYCKPLHRMPWDKKWRPGISADILGERIELPACEKCPFARRVDYAEFCLRPACWSAKLSEHARLETEKAAKAKHIAIAAEGEKVTIVADTQQAQALLASKSPAVRLVAKPDAPGDYYSVEMAKRTSGSRFAAVAVLAKEADAVLKVLSKPKANAQTKGPKDLQTRQREADAKRKTFEAARKQVIEALTPTVVRQLPNDAAVLALIATALSVNSYYGMDKSDREIAEQFRKTHQAKAKAADLKRFIAHEILDSIENWMNGLDMADLRRVYTEAGAALKLQWPAGWDAHLIPPAEKAATVKPKARAIPTAKKAKGKGKKK